MEEGEEETEAEQRTVARCTECGSAYAARKATDGTLVPIGTREGCSCSGTEFVEIDSETVLKFDEDDDAAESN